MGLRVWDGSSLGKVDYVGSQEMFEAMNRAIAWHQIKPVIDRIFPLDETPAAYRYLQSGGQIQRIPAVPA
jgi:NADPH:quinone reductase-like Zn-dependent oxidoreductase